MREPRYPSPRRLRVHGGMRAVALLARQSRVHHRRRHQPDPNAAYRPRVGPRRAIRMKKKAKAETFKGKAVKLSWPRKGVALVTLTRAKEMNTLTLDLLKEMG